jgi:hypothetical protein
VTTTIKNRHSSLHVGSGALLDAARRVQPLLRQEAAASEELGQLTPKVVDALHENGFFGMFSAGSIVLARRFQALSADNPT